MIAVRLIGRVLLSCFGWFLMCIVPGVSRASLADPACDIDGAVSGDPVFRTDTTVDTGWEKPHFLPVQKDVFGGIIRGDTTKKDLYLTFTAHEYDDGYEKIREVLLRHEITASFFVTGQYAKRNREKVRSLAKDGHYIGPHSHRHLLYADWENRKTLVSRKKFRRDIQKNLRQLRKAGVSHAVDVFMPPYEWYNQDIVDWSAELGMQVVDFTPGIRTAADYTFPEMENRYLSSEIILQGLYDKEEKEGLSGYIILIHMGTDPRRKDKLYFHLDDLINLLNKKGYRFSGLDFLKNG